MKNRSSFKHHPLCLSFFTFFFRRSILGEGAVVAPLTLSERSSVITALDCNYVRSVYQGKSFVTIQATPYHLGYKVGAFTKTRKPFYFRSKKKKK
jgi:ribosomal protein S19